MGKRRIIFQDFLFEDMPVDEQDYPMVTIRELPQGYDLESCEILSLDTMLRMDKRKEWESLYLRIKDKDVCIKDDVPLDNPEMEPYKHFYLGAYYFTLSKHSRNVFVA
jgi:hypothetical protein